MPPDPPPPSPRWPTLTRLALAPPVENLLRGPCFDVIIFKIKELLTPERKMINEVITVCKLILVIPATSTAGERTFSTARRLKTWLRSTIAQERFSNLTILNSHKERTDRLSLLDIAANEFTERNSNRKRNCGIVKVSDVQ